MPTTTTTTIRATTPNSGVASAPGSNGATPPANANPNDSGGTGVVTGRPSSPAVSPTPSLRPLGRVVVLYSGKGGAGKTTCTYNLGVALAQAGKKVLLVDFDGGQASLSALAGVDVTRLEYGLYEAMNTILDAQARGWLLGQPGGGGGGGQPSSAQAQAKRREVLNTAARCVRWIGTTTVAVQSKRLAIMANNLELAALETELADQTGREFVLQNFLAYFAPSFDFILIDPPANRGLLTINALTAAHYLLLPIEASSMGFQATCSMLAHPRFLPRITGRSWPEELAELGLDGAKWQELASFNPAGTTGTAPSTTPITTTLNGATNPQTTSSSSNGTGSTEGFDLVAELGAAQAAASQGTYSRPGSGGGGGRGGYGRYPNPELKIAGVIPNRYSPQLADSRLVMDRLTKLFGPGAGSQPGPGSLLLPAIPYSGTYLRSFEGHAAAHELDRRHKASWDTIAQHLIGLAVRSVAQS